MNASLRINVRRIKDPFALDKAAVLGDAGNCNIVIDVIAGNVPVRSHAAADLPCAGRPVKAV